MNKRAVANKLLELAYSLDNEEERELAGKIETILKATKPDEDFWLVSAADMEELERKAKLWDEHSTDDRPRTWFSYEDQRKANGDYPPGFHKGPIREPTIGPRPLGGIDAMEPFTRIKLAVECLQFGRGDEQHRITTALRYLGDFEIEPFENQSRLDRAKMVLLSQGGHADLVNRDKMRIACEYLRDINFTVADNVSPSIHPSAR